MSPGHRWLSCTTVLLLTITSISADYFTSADQGWSAPRIVEQPVSAVVARGQPVTLNCRAAGQPAARITWLQDGRAVAGGRPDRLVLAPGSLFFLAAKERDAGRYQCRAESAAGHATSSNATLTVATLRDEFRRSPRPTQTTRGTDVVLRCDPPRGHPEVTVRWLKNGHPLTMANRLRLERADLHITDVQPSDAGDYVCEAANVLAVRHSRPAALSVLVSPYFVLRPSPGLGLAGGSLLLPCRVGGSPPPRVHWRRLDGALPVGRLHYSEDDSMRIDSLRPSDAGQYSCEAENEAGRISAPVTVTVHVSPSVDSPARKVVRLGSQAALKCQVRGQPVPRGVWWKETEFDPLLADQERGRITTSIQNDLYISPVTSADLGWWVCAATSAAGSVASRVLLHTGSLSRADEDKVTGADSLRSELVHLEEVKVTGQHSVRLTWKTSDRRPVDGFYICYIILPPPDGEASPASPPSSYAFPASLQSSYASHLFSSASRSSAAASPVVSASSAAGNEVRRVTVLNGGAESYELTELRAGAAYQLFLVPFRAGREGRLSRLREVRLPEAVPSAAPGDLSVTFTGSETVVTWSPLPLAVANGRITGYTVTVRFSSRGEPTLAASSSSYSSASASDIAAVPAQLTNSAAVSGTERTYHVTSPRLVLAGRPARLRLRVAAATAAGRGPFSDWWRAGDSDGDGGGDGDGYGDSGSDGYGAGDGIRDGGGTRDVTAPPLTVTATVPRLATGASLPTWLVAVLCCLGLFTLGGGVLALHCHRLRRKQSILAGNTPEMADTKSPPSTHHLAPDSLSQNTLWLRDELFSKNMYASSELDGGAERHVYVKGLSEAAPVGLYASARVVGSLGSVEGGDGASARVVGSLGSVEGGDGSPRPAQHRSLGSARMARRLHSLGVQSARSAPGVSAAPRSQPASPRLRHDRHRASPAPLFGSGSYQECCCYECDYGRGRPPPLPPESPDAEQSDCDDLCSYELERAAAARRRRPRGAGSSGSSGPLAAAERGTPSSTGAGRDAPYAAGAGRDAPYAAGTGRDAPYAAGAGRDAPYAPGAGRDAPYVAGAGRDAPYAAGESSISDSSSSSLYAETDLNEAVHLGGAAERTVLTPPTPPMQQQRSAAVPCGRPPASRTHSLCSADSAYSTPGPSRHSFSNGDGGRPDRSFPATPTDGRSSAKPGRRRRSGSSEQVAY